MPTHSNNLSRAEHIAAIEEDARRESESLGLELVTTAAVRKLTGISQAAVTDAVRRERVDAPFRVSASIGGPEVILIRLRSALEFWAKWLPENAAELIEEMRSDCHIFGVRRLCYNVLHPEPLVRISDIADA